MPKNNKLNDLLDQTPIKRGKGFSLSTDAQQESVQVHKSINALEHNSTNAQVQKNDSAQEHNSTSAQVQKNTNVEVQNSTNAQVQKSISAEKHNSTDAEVRKSTSAPMRQDLEIIRPSKGFKLRMDVADACKLLAVRKKRKLYEVMEEALIEYLQKHGIDIH